MVDTINNNTLNQNMPFPASVELTASGELKAPKNIIQTVTAARSLYIRYREDHLDRIELAAEIEGLVAGNPPYDPAELEEHGLSHITNFNDLTPRSIFDKAALGFWNLYNEVEYIAKFEVGKSSPEELEVAEIFERNFDKVVKKWVNFKHVTCQLISQLLRVGLSPVIWTDERDWRFNVVDYSRFFVSSLAPVNTDYLNCIFVETIFTAQFLFDVYETHKNTRGKDKNGDFITPWNIDALQQLLLYYGNQQGNQSQPFENFVDFQRHYQNKDMFWDNMFTNGFRLVSMFQKEYDGKITHMMFDRGYTSPMDFLYKVDRQYNSFDEAIIIFTSSPGETTLHSNRGVGHKIFGGCHAMMQLDCSINDMAKFTATPFLKSLPGGSRDAEPIRVYPATPTYIGSSEFVQTNFGANIQQLIGASQYQLQKLNYNAANSGDDPSTPDASKGSVSPSQFMAQSFKEFNVLKHNIQFFYLYFDQVIQNMVAKMLQSKDGYPGNEYAQEFYDLCIDDGVPEQILKLFFKVPESKLSKINKKLPRGLEVKASRVAGDGSTMGMLMGLQGMSEIMGDMGPRDALAWKTMFIRSIFGQDYVKTFTQDAQNPDETSGGASLAGVENAIMQMGQAPVFSPDNEHRSHIVTHMALCNHIIMSIKQQQLDAISADKTFDLVVPHTNQHFEVYSKSPFAQKFIDGVKKPWGEIQQYAVLNKKNAAAQVEAELKKRQVAQDQQQQVMSDAQRKDFVAQSDEKRKDSMAVAKETRADQVAQAKDQNEKDKIKRAGDNKKFQIQLEANNKSTESLNNSSNSIDNPDDLTSNNLGEVSTSALSDKITELSGNRPAQYDFEQKT